jgi:hypothetical protein
MIQRILTGIVVTGLIAAPAAAQTETVRLAKTQAEIDALSMSPMRALGVVESKITAGRPYSAEATTEFIQVLGDGNRISRKTTVRLCRDGEGRTRREDLGPGDVVQSVSIYDPVAHVTYMFNPTAKVANKSEIKIVRPQPLAAGVYFPNEQAVAVKQKLEAEALLEKLTVVKPEGGATVALEDADKLKAEEGARARTEVALRGRGGRGTMVAGERAGNPLERVTKEVLGQQMIGGVMAEGTRATTVIAAGAIGNDQEIKIVSEEWRSPELQVLVMTRHSDPRSGETTYRLSNIVRAEPGAGLFEVPADFTIRDMSRWKE